MKKFVLATALAGLSMMAVPAYAQDGFIGASFGRVDAGGGDSDSWGIHGATTLAAGGGMRVLIDGSYSDSNDADVQTLAGTGHLVWDGENHAWGGFLGLVNSDSSGSDTTTVVVGGEYAAFLAGGTFVVSAGYGNNNDTDTDLLGLSGEYRIFVADNTRIDIGAGLIRAESGGADATGLSLGAGIEHQFDGGISVGAAYARLDIDDFGIEADVIALTARFNFGGKTLRARDRTGNTFGQLGGFGSALTMF